MAGNRVVARRVEGEEPIAEGRLDDLRVVSTPDQSLLRGRDRIFDDRLKPPAEPAATGKRRGAGRTDSGLHCLHH